MPALKQADYDLEDLEEETNESLRSVHIQRTMSGITLRVMPESKDGQICIWDVCNLSALRETLYCTSEKKVTIDMSGVYQLPSGTFGMLYNQAELGRKIYLDNPEEEIRTMVWFRMFMRAEEGMFRMYAADSPHTSARAADIAAIIAENQKRMRRRLPRNGQSRSAILPTDD